MENELKAAEAELKRCLADGDEEAVLRAQNRIDGLRNAMKQPPSPKGKSKK